MKSAEIFPVVHSKKANEIKGKWSECLSRVVSKLLNYSKDDVPYGIYFMEPVNPEADSCPDYKKIILHPMDLGTLSNRIYLDYYKGFSEAWKDLGFVFRNCRLYNPNAESDIRVLGDTLSACIILKQRVTFECSETLSESMPSYCTSSGIKCREISTEKCSKKSIRRSRNTWEKTKM